MGKNKFNPKYDEDDHYLWVSKSNRGVSHVGIHLSLLLPCRSIRCNVFHLGFAIGKQLMKYLQTFSLRQSRSFQDKLLTMLETCWSPGVLCLWRIGKFFTQLLGVEIRAFVLKYPEISKLLNEKLTATKEVVALSEVLTLRV